MERTGSIKEKRVSPDLLEERAKCNFNQEELTEIIYGGKELRDEYLSWHKDMEKDPILQNNEKFYEMTREEMMENQMRKIKRLYELNREKYFFKQKATYNAYFYSSLQGLVR